jgi:hypothetical protein
MNHLNKYSAYVGIILVAVVCLLLIWLMVIRFAPPQLLYSEKINQVENIVLKIDKYKAENGKYPPESFISSEPADIFYNLYNDSYRVGFSVGFDEDYYYDSKSKKWSFN